MFVKAVAFCALLLPAAAFAQTSHTPQPITMTPEQYSKVINALAMRDPVIVMMTQLQEQAQADAAKKEADAQAKISAAAEVPPKPDKAKAEPKTAPTPEKP